MKIGPKYKICRRLGSRVFGKCQTTKFSTSGSPVRGGQGRGGSGGRRPRSVSEYGLQLLEKQKARFAYGLKEHQFAAYVKTVRAEKGGSPATALYRMLESRLDNVVYRLGLVGTRAAARQLVTHGHITVNGRRLNIPSYRVKPEDVVAVRAESRAAGVFKTLEERLKEFRQPEWLSFDPLTKAGKVKALPTGGESELDINFGSILEFYSRV
jgi:small subunit ribosomal protein S4